MFKLKTGKRLSENLFVWPTSAPLIEEDGVQETGEGAPTRLFYEPGLWAMGAAVAAGLAGQVPTALLTGEYTSSGSSQHTIGLWPEEEAIILILNIFLISPKIMNRCRYVMLKGGYIPLKLLLYMSLQFSVWGTNELKSKSREDSIQTLSVLILLLFWVWFQYRAKYTGVCMLRGELRWMGMPQSAKILSVRPGRPS